MKGNKVNILEAGLQLYNNHGVPNVSQRTISDFLNISPGNLTYHFKKKQDIYESLYFEFIELVKKEVSSYLHGERTLRTFADLIEKWFYDMHRYRFIFLDLSTLIRNNTKIKNSYRELVEIRKSVFLKVIYELVDSNIMRKQEMKDEYVLLYDRLHIVSDFYLSSIASGKGEKHLNHLEHKELFFFSLYPFLTTKGKEQFSKLFKNKPKLK